MYGPAVALFLLIALGGFSALAVVTRSRRAQQVPPGSARHLLAACGGAAVTVFLLLWSSQPLILIPVSVAVAVAYGYVARRALHELATFGLAIGLFWSGVWFADAAAEPRRAALPLATGVAFVVLATTLHAMLWRARRERG